jgi:hypothetical protein
MGFLLFVKVIYMGLKFLLCHDKNFISFFLMQVLESKYANAMQKKICITTKLPPSGGSGFLSSPNRTSTLGFNIWVYLSVPKMETLILASRDTSNWSIVLVLA